MRILFASSEVHPFSKTGGLADSVGALAKAMSASGHDVRVVTPLYRGILERFPEIKRVDWRFDLPLGANHTQAGLMQLDLTERLKVYFVSQPHYYERAGVYGEGGVDYPDNSERFIFFSKCVAHLARYLPWRPEVLHVHDWHAGLVPMLVAHQRRADHWVDVPTVCLTIHNLAYQGVFPRNAFALTNLPPELFSPEGIEFYGQINCLKAGISTADVITTVSPRYAREITTVEHGDGLDGLLRKRQSDLMGILNGVDYSEWNTSDNPFLAASYSVHDVSGKSRCKAALQAEMKLEIAENRPLFGTVTRLAEQKGVDISLGAIEEMLSSGMQFVLLGSGNPNYERAFSALAARFPGKVAVKIGYDHVLAHRIEAGCDFYLMPSKFEPCGLNQMYSLRYGTLPIVRRTGGLDDTVVDLVDLPLGANGIKFSEYSIHGLSNGIRKALAVFENKPLYRHYQRNGMLADFSWEHPACEYERAYTKAKQHRPYDT